MKRTHLLHYTVMGSVVGWPVEVDISRNDRRDTWTVYFRYTDPEARGSETYRADDAEELLSVLDGKGVDVTQFCDALRATRSPELAKLAEEVREADVTPRWRWRPPVTTGTS